LNFSYKREVISQRQIVGRFEKLSHYLIAGDRTEASKAARKRYVRQIGFIAVSKLDTHGEGPVVAVSEAASDTPTPVGRNEFIVVDNYRVWEYLKAVIAPHLPAITEGMYV
jgi:hypothetical protein